MQTDGNSFCGETTFPQKLFLSDCITLYNHSSGKVHKVITKGKVQNNTDDCEDAITDQKECKHIKNKW